MNGTLSPIQGLTGTLSPAQGLDGSLSPFTAAYYPEYSGAYEFTPSEETQTVETARTVLLSDITINPIPSNYGRIETRGSALYIF